MALLVLGKFYITVAYSNGTKDKDVETMDLCIPYLSRFTRNPALLAYIYAGTGAGILISHWNKSERGREEIRKDIASFSGETSEDTTIEFLSTGGTISLLNCYILVHLPSNSVISLQMFYSWTPY